MVLRMYFKNHDYNDDDLGAPSNVISVRENYPLDGATPMERPPLGGEGYQRDVNSLIDRFDVSLVERKELSVRWSYH
jgi:hypothetical protein